MKNTIDILKITGLGILLLIFQACMEDFEELNTNPNQPNQVPTSQLLTSAQRALVGEIYGVDDDDDGESRITWLANNYVQYLSDLRGGNEDIYLEVQTDFSKFYQDGLNDLDEIIQLNKEAPVEFEESGATANQLAVARILKAWAFHNITDTWGDIPYSEALKGTDNALPEYDTQEEIYNNLLTELTEASAQIDLNAAPVKGDLIFDGNMEYWQKFANSLKMRVGLRLSEVRPELAERMVAEAYEAGVFTGNEQNALFNYTNSKPNRNPHYTRFFVSVPNQGVTNSMIDKLKDLNDPRLSQYADPAQLDDEGGGYIGMPFGLNVASASGIRDKAVSWPDEERVLSNDAPFVIMSYAEVLFMQAEAAERGWIEGDAATLYEKGIEASMKYWGVDESAIQQYLDQDQIAYDTSNPMMSIGNQKWLALYMQGTQAWAEWRRLDYPQLDPAPDGIIDQIPRRSGYPASEINLNEANYRTAVDRQGPDNLTTRVWWDVE